jgi:predicted nuclease of predicted toxin-antitoxin system
VLRLLTDEDINGNIVRGVRRRLPHADILRVQEVGLRTKDDQAILDWAARDGRTVISNDRDTMIGFAYERVARGLPMPGLFVLRSRATIGEVIEALAIANECSSQEEWKNRVQFLP